MQTVLKTELKRALVSRGMLISLLAGCGIVLWHQIVYVWNPAVELENEFCPESLFYNWIGASCFPMQSYLYYLILPILAVLPTADSLFQDIHSGYYRNIYLRHKKKEYLAAKYISVFVSGGGAVVLPLLLSLLLTALRFPALRPEPIMSYGPLRTSVGFLMFYKHPWIYTGIFLIIDFVFAGGIAGISLLATYFAEHKFAVLIAPFVCYYFVFSLDDLLGGYDIAPNYFLMPGFEKNNIWEYVIGIAILFLTAIIYFWKGYKRE